MKKGHKNHPSKKVKKSGSYYENPLTITVFSVFSIFILHLIFVSATGHSPDAAEIVKSSEAGKIPYSGTQKQALLKNAPANIPVSNETPYQSIFITDSRQVSLTNAQEKILINAIKDIDADRWQEAQKKIASLESNFGRRLFNWLWLLNYKKTIPFKESTAFLSGVSDWPGTYTIRKKLEKSLDAQDYDDPSLITSWFDKYPPLTPGGIRYYIHYLDQEGRTDKAKEFLKSYWESSTSTSNDQQHFYQTYKDWLDPSSHVRRLDTLLFARQYTNARNLAEVMGNDYKKLVEARIALAENKSGVGWYIRQVPENLQDNPGLVYERLHWRRRHDLNDRAIDLLNFPPEAEQLSNPAEWWLERHIMARRMIEQGDIKRAYSLAANHRQTGGLPYAQAEWLSGFLALQFMDKPVFALEHFQNLFNNVETPISRARGAYWCGRAQEKLGQYEQAAKWYKTASHHGATFYGQMARAAYESVQDKALKRNASFSGNRIVIDEPVSFSPDTPMPEITFEAQSAFNKSELRQAAFLLKKAGLKNEAEAFIEALTDKAKYPMDYRLVADFALSVGLPHKALAVAKEASYNSIVLKDHQFPTVFNLLENIDSVEWALLQGVMRQESAFNPAARSHAGARGMMQIMPATALALARKYNIPHKTSWLTDQPHHNVKLGSIYMRDLLKRFDDSYILAVAAYNAGPGRVRNWLELYGDPRQGDISWIDWMELIPIYETRNYVQRVLEAALVYRTLPENTLNGDVPEILQIRALNP